MKPSELTTQGAPDPVGTNHSSRSRAARLASHQVRHARYVDELLHPPDSRWRFYTIITALLVGILLLAFSSTPRQLTKRAPCSPNLHVAADWSNCVFAAVSAEGANLSGANLRNVSLLHARLRGTRLTGADLSYAQLMGADLSHAHLARSELVGANLQHANLARADLRDADMSYVNLLSANLVGAILDGARLDHAIWADGAVCLEGSTGHCLVVASDP